MNQRSRNTPVTYCRIGAALMVLVSAAGAVQATEPLQNPTSGTDAAPEVLSDAQWQLLETTVDDGLKFLATQQAADGSFPTLPHAKPGVTGLCILAFLSRGHLPNEGPYGRQVQRGVEFVLSTQREDGLWTNHRVEPTLTSHGVSHAALYNHGIAGLMLGEVYGITGGGQNKPMGRAIVKGLEFSRSEQLRVRQRGRVSGGFDYLVSSSAHPGQDLPITSCQLLFYRSALNAGFDVPEEYAQDALRYVQSCYDPGSRTFLYRGQRTFSRGLTASAILSLALAGEHDTEMARQAGRWVQSQSFDRFNQSRDSHDRYFYSAYYCSQAMFQLGGDYWRGYFPPVLNTLAEHQRDDGSWDEERSADTARYGNVYSSALAILALTPPYQLLPIYQR